MDQASMQYFSFTYCHTDFFVEWAVVDYLYGEDCVIWYVWSCEIM